ncbi:MAG: HD domain-containing protein [Desulfobacterales bacterium]|nr:HD domain-containing protein [Desulfobacterales bacterium]
MQREDAVLLHRGVGIASADSQAQGVRSGSAGMLRDRTEKKRLEMDLLESYRKLQHARAATILGLAKLAEYRDEGTGTHLERIREYARLLAEEMASMPGRPRGRSTSAYIDDIYQSAILHDIGKVGIPDAVLLKPGELTNEEFEVIKCHTVLRRGRHHRHPDPDRGPLVSEHRPGDRLQPPREMGRLRLPGAGFEGQAIPLAARIVAVADVYDALTTKRFYKEAFSARQGAGRSSCEPEGQPFRPGGGGCLSAAWRASSTASARRS